MYYYCYVIELDSSILKTKIFRLQNPNYINGNDCLYVGQSFRKPEIRFEQHKEGYKANKYAKKFGLKLRPDLYEKYNPIPTRKDALDIEKMLSLREDLNPKLKLSMGMSNDYEVALKFHSDIIRIGSLLFS